MGCDIHDYFEIKNGDKWERLITRREELRDLLYGPGSDERDEKMSQEERSKLLDEMWEHPLDIGRNYDLFAILADVRNGRGFAGIVTGTGFDPISDPKGLPDDCSEGVLDEYCTKFEPEYYDDDYTEEDWIEQAKKWVAMGYSQLISEKPFRVSGPDWHSASWFTLKELLDYDGWDKTTTHTGIVDQESYAKWDRDKPGFPPSMSGGVMGLFVEHIEEAEMQRRIKQGLPAQEDGERENHDGTLVQGKITYYTRVAFEMTYRDSCKSFTERTLPFLKQYADEHLDGDYERLRFVFWFDN